MKFIGNNTITNLVKILEENNPQSIFLVTGNNSYELCGAKNIIEEYLKPYKYVRFYDFEENPKIKDIESGMLLYQKHKCDFVIAIGGGSVIDIAKSINSFQLNKNYYDIILRGKKIINKGNKLVAIPTTYGTGTEATHFSVLYVEGKKYSIADTSIFPDYSIVDSQFALNAPKSVLAVAGIDAFTHAVESLWSVNSTSESSKYSKEAIKLLLEYLPSFVNNNTNKLVRDKVAIASNLAGKAINIAKTTAPHALSYYLTSKFNIPHGQAVAVFLADFLEYNFYVTDEDCNDVRGAEYVRNVIKNLFLLFAVDNIKDAKQKVIDFINSISLASNIDELNIDISIEEVYRNVNIERMKNNPRRVN